MTFLPIVERELRVASRKHGTYWLRVSAALGALLISGFIMLLMHRYSPRQLGQTIFVWLSSVTYFFSVMTGALLTSDSLSEEKRDGTLGLLFLTDLKGYDIVFGKLVANSLGSFYAMLSVFPVLAISLLLGGVTYGELGRVALVSINILFLSLGAGMFASSISRDERKAMSLAFLLLLLLAIGPLLGGAIYYYDKQSSWNDEHLLLSPGYACFLAFDFAYRAKQGLFWTSAAITHAYAWLFLILACRIVPRSWQTKADSARKEKAQRVLTEVTQGKPDARQSYRTRLLDVNPFYWLAARDRMKPRLVWGFLIVGAIFWVLLSIRFGKGWFNPATYFFTAVLLHTTLKSWLAGEACRRVLEDRRSGALELMLSTPIRVGDIVRGQHFALAAQFVGPALCVALINVVMMFASFSEYRTDRGIWVAMWLCGIGVFLFDLYAMSWLGMWQGMVQQKVNRATGGTVSRILFLPWLAFGMTFAIYGVLSVFSVFRNVFQWNFPGWVFLGYWVLLCVINNVIWIRFSRERLYGRFREIATQKFEAGRPFWAFLKADKPPVVADR